MTDVYYIVSQPGEQQGTSPKGTLLRRGRELHAPDHMLVTRSHVVFMEPVAPSSRIAELIKEMQNRDNTK